MRKAALHNLGCKVNAYETEAMQQLLEENGYVQVGKIGSLELTEKGKAKAESVYARHILLTEFLVEIAKVSKEQAEINACRIEHYIDEDVKKGIERWMEENKS